MIKELTVNNFQSHKQSSLTFSNGVNVIIGPSDSGKTAILRALNWVLWNRPLGNAFCSYWGGETSAKIKLSDGPLIVRKRNENMNGYLLKDKNGTQKFEAIKTDIPEEISKALNLTSINVQQQLDSPFLLDDSPGEVAHHFNSIAHLDMIDSSTKKIMEEKRALDWKIKLNLQEQETKEEQLQKFENLVQVEIRVEELEEAQQRQINLSNNAKALSTLKQQIQDTSYKLEKYNYVKPAQDRLIELQENISCKKDIDHQILKIKELITEIENKTNKVKGLTKVLSTKDKVQELEKAFTKATDQKQKISSLHKLLVSIGTEKEKIKYTDKKYTDLKQIFEKEFPDICPLCGQEVRK